MANYATENIRTVALVGQGGAGKTTLAEALLLKTGMIKEAGSVERGTTVADFDPLEKTWQHSLRSSILHLDTPEVAHPPDRHARLSRFHRPGDRRARRGGNGRRRRERAVGARDDRVADDGVGGQATAVPPRDRQQDRRRERRPAEGARRDPGRLRQGMPADQPAGGRRPQSRRLLLQSRRRVRFLVGRRRAPIARGPGRRGRRGADVALSRAGRGRAGSTARAVREGAARRPLRARLLRLRADRRGHRRTAQRLDEARAQSRGGQPATLLQGGG